MWCGVAAGPVFVGVTAADAVTRDGFDLRRHGLSLLSLGDRGWIQVSAFVVAGVLSIAFGEGVRRRWDRDREARVTAGLIWVYGAGLVGTGVFLVDPGIGFPAGAPAGLPEHLSWHGAVHAVAPPVAFLSLTAVTFLLARRYARERRWWRAGWSLITGLSTLGLLCWPGDGGSIRSAVAVVLTSAWTTAFAADLLRETSPPQPV